MRTKFFIIFFIVVICIIMLPSAFMKHKSEATIEEIKEKVTYNTDNSVTFIGIGGKATFTEEQLPELEKILKKADALDKECTKSIEIDTEISLGKIGGYEFRYLYSRSGVSILGVFKDYSYIGIHQGDKYISYLTTYKDRYFKEQSKYDKQMEELNRIKSKLDIK